MTVRQMESFIVLCEEMHFGKAALRLGISQPSLSQQMALLEKELGVTLISRIGRSFRITKAGQVYLQHAVKINKELEQTQIEMNYFRFDTKDNIKLGVSGSHLVVDVLKRFTDAFPDTQLDISENSTRETIEKIKDKLLDIGLVYETVDDQNLISEILFTDELLAVIPKDHELAEKEGICLKDFDNEPLILLDRHLLIRQYIDKIFSDVNVVPNIICELGHFYGCLAYCQEQIGLTLLVRSMLRTIPDQVVVKTIRDLSYQKKLVLVYRKDLYIDDATSFLLEEIRNLKVGKE